MQANPQSHVHERHVSQRRLEPSSSSSNACFHNRRHGAKSARRTRCRSLHEPKDNRETLVQCRLPQRPCAQARPAARVSPPGDSHLGSTPSNKHRCHQAPWPAPQRHLWPPPPTSALPCPTASTRQALVLSSILANSSTAPLTAPLALPGWLSPPPSTTAARAARLDAAPPQCRQWVLQAQL